MKMRDALVDALDFRPEERRPLSLAMLGAFLVMSFFIAARSLRDAFYLDEFDVERLPFVTAVVAALGIPVVTAFTRGMVRRDGAVVYRRVLLWLAAGIVLLQAAAWEEHSPLVQAATIAFYLWTALGSLLVTSGFWMLTAESFELRDAKRLFGVIGAGGTLGAMLSGLAMGPIGSLVGNAGLVAMLWLMLLALWAQQRAMARFGRSVARPARMSRAPVRVRDAVAAVRDSPHLRAIAAIVALSTIASYMVDYQFKAAAAEAWHTDEELVAFFGRFHGISGFAGLLLQLLVAGPVLAGPGVAAALAVLPLVLLGGTSLQLIAPGLLALTLLRGADNAVRRSLQRSVVEYLYVPLAPSLRRRTKAFIDSAADSAAEGVAAVLVLLALAAGVAGRVLPFFVVALAVALLWLARQMQQRYVRTLRQRLQDGRKGVDDEFATAEIVDGEVSVSVSAFDLDDVLEHSGLAAAERPDDAGSIAADTAGEGGSLQERLASADPAVVHAALGGQWQWHREHVEPLIRLLARDAFTRSAADALVVLGEPALADIEAILMDEGADFVIRRRLPSVLARIPGRAAADVVIAGLDARRFEVRYRSGVALAHRRAHGMSPPNALERRVWAAIRHEVGHERPIWELQQLLDARPANDVFVAARLADRGALSLEHTFRLLSLVIEEGAVRTAFQGVMGENLGLRSLSLEYLEHVLPVDVRDRLWPFIGDLSERRRRQQLRPMDQVVGELLKTGATLFGNVEDRERLRHALAPDDDANP